MEFSYLVIAAQAWFMMALTGANVKLVARGNYAGGYCLSVLISVLWWTNSNSAAHSHLEYARWVYALSAGFGTITGMWLVKRFSREQHTR